MTDGALLNVSELTAGYGESQVLFDVSFSVSRGEVVTLLGRNGMGKTTTVSAVMGIVSPRGGSVVFEGEPLNGLPVYRIARRGLSIVPEGRQIFPNLSVAENLIATAANRSAETQPWTVERVLALFPPLVARIGSMGILLSGGEQQMLAIGRALMTNPRLLILDEATEGLAPLICEEIWRVIGQLKLAGQSILIIDKNVSALSRIADRHYVLERGRIVWTGDSRSLQNNPELQHRYLGV